MSNSGLFTGRGIYSLIIFLSEDSILNVGMLGSFKFVRGYYTYTGSGLGTGISSLRGRILRHMGKKKQKFWHIDYFLDHENVTLTSIIAAQTSKKRECEINLYLKEWIPSKLLVIGFGASDCTKTCKSHLLFFPEIKKDALKEKVSEAYLFYNLFPVSYSFEEEKTCFSY